MNRLELEKLGHRICILGPSNSGKSTLAARISRKLNIPCHHLDQISHVPYTNWQSKPQTDFIAAHHKIVTDPAWIIDGNYGSCMPDRLAYANSVIWIDPPLAGALWRYVLRSLRNDPTRPGRLEGATKEFSFKMVRYTLVQYPQNKKHYTAFLQQFPHLRIIKLNSMRELNNFYKDNDL